MIGTKFMMWVGAGVLSAAMIPAVSEARSLAAHKLASSPTALTASSPLHKSVKTAATAKKTVKLHSSHKLTKLTSHRLSHVKLTSKVKHTTLHSKRLSAAKLHAKHIAASKLHSHVKHTAAPAPTM